MSQQGDPIQLLATKICRNALSNVFRHDIRNFIKFARFVSSLQRFAAPLMLLQLKALHTMSVEYVHAHPRRQDAGLVVPSRQSTQDRYRLVDAINRLKIVTVLSTPSSTPRSAHRSKSNPSLSLDSININCTIPRDDEEVISEQEPTQLTLTTTHDCR